MSSFALIGASGYIAPRHMQAIKATGGDLKVAFDPRDSVGVIDSYFPNSEFFTEFERFDRHLDKMRRRGEKIDLVSICSPNYLHDAHCRFALRSHTDAICEKPLVLNPWNIDALAEIEHESGKRIWTILQLRLHPAVQELRKKIEQSSRTDFSVDLTYITSRGRWYQQSWKGDESKSGGIATNIGVHFFAMLAYVFGPFERNVVHLCEPSRASGYLRCARAQIRWFLSIDARDLPEKLQGKTRTFRSISVDGEEVEFSDGFADLHTLSYKEILVGNGFGLDAVRPSIEVVSAIRAAPIQPGLGEQHRFNMKKLSSAS